MIEKKQKAPKNKQDPEFQLIKILIKMYIIFLASFLGTIVAVYSIIMVVKVTNYKIDKKYASECNWSCSEETFKTEYYEAYVSEIESLETKYGLSLDKAIRFSEDYDALYCYLYAKEYYICLSMENDDGIGKLEVELTYYAGVHKNPKDFDIIPALNFLNDFANFAGYETKTDKNYFESLYSELLADRHSNEKEYIYHKSREIGDVGYSVRSSAPCSYTFCFEGLLKPLLPSAAS